MALNLSQQIYQKLPSSAKGESGGDFEIPIYIRSQESPKWVSGIERSTTCQDILESVLRSKVGPDADLNHYTLVEHWRGVERPLSRNSKILKLWLAWGDEQNHVKFVVKKTRVKDQEQENLTTKKSARTRNKVRRRNSNSSVGSKTSDTMHPKVLSRHRGSSKSSPDIQEMMKVILNQGQVIYQELQRRGYQPNPNLSDSISALNRSQSEMNLSQESKKSGSATISKPSKNRAIREDNLSREALPDDDLGYGEDMSPPNTTDIIDELIRLHSLNEELQTVETKLHILSANLNQFMAPNLTDPKKTATKSSAPMKEDHHHHHLSNNNDPRGNLAECTLQQELDSVKRYNQSAMEDISRNKELISAMELEFKTKKDSIKQLEYDFNLIEKEGKKLGREYEKVLSIEIPDADKDPDLGGSEDSALEDSTQIIYTELKELKLECQRITSSSSSDPDQDPTKILTSPVLTPASASESGVDLSHEGSTSGSESSGPRPSPLSHSEPLDSKLSVHDFCSTESRSRIKSSRSESTRHGLLDDGEDSNSDTGLSSLHSSSDEGAYEFGTLV